MPPHSSVEKPGTLTTRTSEAYFSPNNAIAPDITETEGLRALSPSGLDARLARVVPLGRAGHVDECAGAAVFLASELSSYVTGQTIHVDGGNMGFR